MSLRSVPVLPCDPWTGRRLHVANLADQRCRLIIKQRDLRIRRFSAILEGKPAPDAERPRRRMLLPHQPPAKVNDVDAIVAHFPIAGVPKPMPFVIQLLAHQRPFACGPVPQVVVYRVGNWRWSRHPANAKARPIHQCVNVADVRILGTCPAPVAGAADITGLYTARFGVPAVGSKVFVVANQYVDGYEDLGTEFTAMVPAEE